MPKKKATSLCADAPVTLTSEPMQKPVLGLDLGLAKTGWSKYRPGTVDNTNGLITPVLPDPADPFGEMKRLKTIVAAIRALLLGDVTEQCCNAGLVVIEGFSFGSMNTQAHKIGGLGYLVRYMVWSHGVPFIIVSPLELKKFATGKPKAEKAVILKQVLKNWQVDLDDDDVADAFVLTMVGRALTRTWEPETGPQREVLKALAARNKGLLKTAQ